VAREELSLPPELKGEKARADWLNVSFNISKVLR
jgi:hypothetical protein